ncbi:MAG: hypothetical protein GF364_11350 [Candidatus Lokiarchaeota archaeon]|nr:hypothetical protein [Candidatus Lokiarchaeota archaeon]
MGTNRKEKGQNLAVIPLSILIILFCTSIIITTTPILNTETDKYRSAWYNSERKIMTSYFYWYETSGDLESNQQVIHELSPEKVADIEEHISTLPEDWPGATNIDEIVSFNATGDGRNYTDANSHHVLASTPTYNEKGEVTSSLTGDLPIYETDKNGLIPNITSWFNYSNPEWHEWEMRCMMRAGIDVAIPVYWWTGPEYNQNQWSRDGLIVLNESLTNLRSKVQSEKDAGGIYSVDDVPKLAMFFDTTLLKQMWAKNVSMDPSSEYYGDYNTAHEEGEGADLTDPYWENEFYLRIKEFYDIIINSSNVFLPEITFKGITEEYCVVWLYGANWVKEVGDKVFDYCREQFEARFGKKLVFCGGNDWFEPGVDGICGWGASTSIRTAQYSKIPVGGYGGGYYNFGALIVQGASYSEWNNQDYKAGLQEAIDSGALWLHLETWNELLEGTDICWTYESRFTKIDATREIADVFHGITGQPSLTQQMDLILVILPLVGLIGIFMYWQLTSHKTPIQEI